MQAKEVLRLLAGAGAQGNAKAAEKQASRYNHLSPYHETGVASFSIMNIQLHQNARTTPAIRLEIQAQPESVSNRELAAAYKLNRHTVAKWR